MNKLSMILEYWEFIKVRRKFWLLPIIIFLIIFSTIMVLSEGSAVAPFIYAIF